MEPRTTPGLIAYKIEVKVLGHWYLWGLSATVSPHGLRERLPPEEEVRATPVWASRHFELELGAPRVY